MQRSKQSHCSMTSSALKEDLRSRSCGGQQSRKTLAPRYSMTSSARATSVGGKTGPTPTTVHYDFSTQGIGGSTSGLDLIKKMTGSAAINPNDTPVRTYLLWASIMP